jgi:gluconokinase
MVILVMGVSGSGKTTVGSLLAHDLGWTFADADDFHPAANVAKMAAGHPLDDADRAPWLTAIRAFIDRCLSQTENAVVTCSALKERYRQVLTAGASEVKLVYLYGNPALLRARLSARPDHFMKPTMLDSQIAALEPPTGALSIDVAATPPEIVQKIRRVLAV